MKVDDLLASYPSLRGDAEYTDSDALADLKEWSTGAKIALELVRDSAERFKMNTAELDAVALQFDAAGMDRTQPLSVQAETLQKHNHQLRARAEETDVNLSELHIAIRQALGAESVAEALETAAQLRRMLDGASVDLDRERRAHQEAMNEAAARELKLTEERELTLTEERDWWKASCDVEHAQYAQHVTDLAAARHSLSVSESNLSGMRACVQEALRAVANVGGPADAPPDDLTPCQMVEWIRDRAYDVEGWRLQCGTNELTIARLAAKVKRLESAGSGARFALTSEPRAAQLRADIVVDAKSGVVTKNRLHGVSYQRIGLDAPKPNGAERKKPARAGKNACSGCGRTDLRVYNGKVEVHGVVAGRRGQALCPGAELSAVCKKPTRTKAKKSKATSAKVRKRA